MDKFAYAFSILLQLLFRMRGDGEQAKEDAQGVSHFNLALGVAGSLSVVLTYGAMLIVDGVRFLEFEGNENHPVHWEMF